MTQNSEPDSQPSRSSFKRVTQVSLKSLLLLATFVAIFLAVESNRHYNQQRLIAKLKTLSTNDDPCFETEQRYSWLNRDEFAWANKFLGDEWNRDLTSITIYGTPSEADELYSRICKLKRLRILSVCSSVSDHQAKKFARIKSLQWLLICGPPVEIETRDYLRERLPNTFVSILPSN